MPRLTRVFCRSTALVCVLIGVLHPVRQAPPTRAASVAVEPPALDISVPLGQSTTASLLVQNISPATHLRVYEAEAEAFPQTRAVLPTELRRAQLPRQAERLDSQLLDAFGEAPEQPVEFVVYLQSQADLSQAYRIRNWNERGRFVVETLIAHAAQTQADLQQFVTARGRSYQSLWIVNAVLVYGDLSDAQALASRGDVALVRANRVMAVPQAAGATPAAVCSPDQPENPLCWNIRATGADRVWRDFGVTGRGIVVANIDTGVEYTHPALVEHYRGNNGTGSFDHQHNWFDPQGRFSVPTDENGHGTHTMGTLAGSVGDNFAAVGVAPDSRWIAAQGCESYFCNDADLLSSAQWMLAPTRLDGSEPRADLRPMIVSNSWAGMTNDPWYAPYIAAWRAAGIFPVFAIGNVDTLRPQACGTASSPGDYAEVLAVGAVDRAGMIAPFSLLGPTRDGRVKPDLVAPGQQVYSALPAAKGTYGVLNGTSMAAPHVSAAVALLWSANPALIGDYDTTVELLRASAAPVSDTRCADAPGSPNNVYGHGRLDVYAAVARARVDVPWLHVDQLDAAIGEQGQALLSVQVDAGTLPGPGVYQARVQLFDEQLGQPLSTIPVTLRVGEVAGQVQVRGQVRDAETGAVIHARVGVSRDATAALLNPTTTEGAFQLTLLAGVRYALTARANGYLPLRQDIVASEAMKLELRMTPDQPRLVAPNATMAISVPFATTREMVVPIANEGARPLYYQASVARDSFVVSHSGQPDGPTYEWIELGDEATTLKPKHEDDVIKDIPLGIRFPFYTLTITDSVVTTDGMLAFDRPFSYHGPTTNCLPDEWINFYMIAPLRLDLDPLKGGRIRYDTVDNRFVLSYEDVPLHNGPADMTYTFQLVLHPDGRMIFQYKQLAALPNRASVGVQRSPGDVQEIGCGPSAPIRDGTAIELRPQPNSGSWMKTSTVSGTLQPGERIEIPLRIDWARPSPLLAYYQGRLILASNDVRRPQLVVPVRLYASTAPHEVWLLQLSRR